MTYRLERLPDKPVLLWTVNDGFDIGRDLPRVVSDAIKILDGMDEDVYYMADARKLKLNFGGVVSVLATLTRGELALFKHPRIYKIVGVSNSGLIELAIKALGQMQYGAFRTAFYTSLDEAFAGIEREVASRKGDA